LIYVLSLTIIYTYEANNFICSPRFVLIGTRQCIYFIAFRLCVFAPIHTTAFTPFVYAGLLRLKVCPSPCSCLPYICLLTHLKHFCFSYFFEHPRLRLRLVVVITLPLPLWGNATQILPFHFSHLWRYVTLPFTRKCSVVYPCAYALVCKVVDLCALSLTLFYLGISRRSALYGVSPSLSAFRCSRLSGGVLSLCCVLLFYVYAAKIRHLFGIYNKNTHFNIYLTFV
jgi:hypothetical protein